MTVFIEIVKMYWLFAGSISRILWCLEPIRPATVNCRFILTSFYLFTRKLCQKATIFFWRKKNSAEINLQLTPSCPWICEKLVKRDQNICVFTTFLRQSLGDVVYSRNMAQMKMGDIIKEHLYFKICMYFSFFACSPYIFSSLLCNSKFNTLQLL